MALDDEALREAASHRGLKLVKSRKRTPGIGDYGFFGLTDGAGKPLFGIGETGLTASAQEIADYLRKGEASTWAESAKVTPARAKRDAQRQRPSSDEEASADPVIRQRQRKSAIAPEPKTPIRDRAAASVAQPETKPVPKPAPKPDPEPELRIRTARAADAEVVTALLSLIGFAGGARKIERAISAASARKEPILVADRGGVVGCLAWHAIPTVQAGPLARITAIVVEECRRRDGIGRALYDAAAMAIGKRGIDTIEAMSDVAVRNANGFYRAIGLTQIGYRFGGKP
jgi:N-acetylglutamate synthase-like GNAT family acetyltransferase